jgi:hypothetical protein
MRYFEKIAALKPSVQDVETHLGFLLPSDQDEKINEMAEQAVKKSFILRHPFLTGLPTLGLAPAIAHSNAIENIARNILKKEMSLHNQFLEIKNLCDKKNNLRIINEI